MLCEWINALALSFLLSELRFKYGDRASLSSLWRKKEILVPCFILLSTNVILNEAVASFVGSIGQIPRGFVLAGAEFFVVPVLWVGKYCGSALLFTFLISVVCIPPHLLGLHSCVRLLIQTLDASGRAPYCSWPHHRF